MTPTNQTGKKRFGWQLALLVAMFAIPPIAAWFFYFNPEYLPQSHDNQGELITPQREVVNLHLLAPNGDAFNWNALKDQWTLALVVQGRCEQKCLDELIQVRQIRKAMAANQVIIQRMLILVPDAAGLVEQPVMDGLEGTMLGQASAAERQQVLELFGLTQTDTTKNLFIIDPRVDLMMRYDTAVITSKQILKDLEKLLKASQSWVREGGYGHK